MKRYAITTGTVTYAIKGRDLLRRNGYNAKIERRTREADTIGCGYSVVFDGDLKRAQLIFKQAGVKILKTSEIN